jgi:acetylornithine deacetylase/succinyl-diaminopimelate desuccinylase-like protein
MKAEGYIPERDIIVALTTDEEGGPHNGVQWLLANRPDLIDAEYALNEGGGGVMEQGRRLSNGVQASEKMFLNLRLEVTNPGGHSSVPVPDNAIYHLAAALVKVGAFRFPARLNEVTRAYFSRSAGLVDAEAGAAMRALVANPADRAALGIVSRNPANNSRLRTTCVATMLEAGHATNALPQRARANVNCRLLPDEDPARVVRAFDSLIANPKVTVTPLAEVTPSPPSPLTPALMTAIEQVTGELWPGIPVVPTMSTGATDGLFLRNAGIPVYGVSGLFYENANAHGMNETISAEAFYQGLEFLYRLARRLTGGGVS